MDIYTGKLEDINEKSTLTNLEILECTSKDSHYLALYKNRESEIGEYKYAAWILLERNYDELNKINVKADLRWGQFRDAVLKTE